MSAPKLKYAIGNAASTTLSTGIVNTDTAAPLTADTNFSAKSGEGMVLLDEGSDTEELAYSTTKSGGALTIPLANRGIEGGTPQGHSSGASVRGVLSAGMWNDLIDAMLNFVDQVTGALDVTKVADLTTSQSLTHKTITDSTNNVTAKSLKSATTTVDVSAATAPSAGQVLTATDSTHATWQSGGGDGWVSYSTVTPTSGTLDSPTFELTFAGVDLTSTLQAGMRIKFTQSTVKYFIITKVAFSTNTTVTIYGGTDYALISTGTTAVSALSYSSAKVPFGFPADPTKWTVRVTDTTGYSQASAVQDTWYNLGTTASQISIPIGIWNTTYQVSAHISTNAQIYTALSTANNSASDSEFVASYVNPAAAFGGTQLIRTKTLTATSKTTYYLNTKTSSASTPTIYNRNDTTNGTPLIIEARCAYL